MACFAQTAFIEVPLSICLHYTSILWIFILSLLHVCALYMQLSTVQ